MRRAAVTIATSVVLATTPALAPADWRESPMNEGCVQEPCDETVEGHDDDQWSNRDPRQDLERPIERQFQTRGLQGRGNQPYWGTMRPYWNAPEPPGVIHRGARTRGFHK